MEFVQENTDIAKNSIYKTVCAYHAMKDGL